MAMKKSVVILVQGKRFISVLKIDIIIPLIKSLKLSHSLLVNCITSSIYTSKKTLKGVLPSPPAGGRPPFIQVDWTDGPLILTTFLLDGEGGLLLV